MKPERLEQIRRDLVQHPAYPLGKQEVVDLATELLAEVDRLQPLVRAARDVADSTSTGDALDAVETLITVVESVAP